MKVTRNQNGAIQIDGKSIDMYLLAYWLYSYNSSTGSRLRPSRITEEHLRMFIKEVPNAIKEER